MNFLQYLTEAPFLDDDIESNPKKVQREYEHQLEYNKNKMSEYKFGDYKIVMLDGYETSAYLLKGDEAILMAEYIVNEIDGKDFYFNNMIQKGSGKLEKNLIVEFIFELSKKLKCNGIMSGSVQSKGGRKLWENLLKHAVNGHSKEVGVFNNTSSEFEAKDESVRLPLWLMRLSTKIYGKTDDKTKYQLYILF